MNQKCPPIREHTDHAFTNQRTETRYAPISKQTEQITKGESTDLNEEETLTKDLNRVGSPTNEDDQNHVNLVAVLFTV